MKIRILHTVLIGIVCWSQLSTVVSANDESRRKIFWRTFGQQETLKKGELYDEYWGELEKENCIVQYSDKGTEFILQLLYQRAALDTISIPLQVSIPSNGNAPVYYTKFDPRKKARTIAFDTIGHSHIVHFGETVNLSYGQSIPLRDVYVRARPAEGGYLLETAKLSAPTVVELKELCDIQVVQSPAVTTVLYDKRLRYEQIIWTPRVDGTWEVRIGTKQGRGCNSPALEELQLLQKGVMYNKLLPRKRK